MTDRTTESMTKLGQLVDPRHKGIQSANINIRNIEGNLCEMLFVPKLFRVKKHLIIHVQSNDL